MFTIKGVKIGPSCKSDSSFSIVDMLNNDPNMEICQVFLKWFNIKKMVAEYIEIGRICKERDITLIIHADHHVLISYKPQERKLRYASKKYIDDVLRLLEHIGGKLVVHIGKGEKCDIKHVPGFLASLNTTKNLLIENAAGQGTEIGKSWEELKFIANNSLDAGFCFDTQHSFGAGLCNYENEDEISSLFENLDEIFGERLELIHLNDSSVEFNSRIDRHGNVELLEGKIWKKTNLVVFLRECMKRKLMACTETASDVDYLKAHQLLV